MYIRLQCSEANNPQILKQPCRRSRISFQKFLETPNIAALRWELEHELTD